MSITRRFRRPAQLCAVACALLAPAMSGATSAAADPRAQERYYMSYSTADPTAQEQYYSSYGEPQPLPPAAPSNDTPWLPIALSIAGALAIVAVCATQLRRVRVRRRSAAQPAA